ncbi:ABC transporter [Paenibacillus sp. D9]|uniref:ABC transporter permease n=1 Tax=Paenibacillus sp. D9 TaxID=665792 RepID=UPI00061F1468|nr:ABC transporter permease [Paenibacillus sp. D9]KKC48120.1 ABC transporter [Paenibacillus sp. D9]
MYHRLQEVYQYRQMLKSMVLTDLRTRYKGSVLGFLWTFINPLLMLVIYSVVFSSIMRMNIENYPMFLFVAILPWIFFSTSVQNSAGVVLRNNSLVKKIYFPREILPISVVIGGIINYLFGLCIMIPACLLFGVHMTAAVAIFPVLLIIHAFITLGICFIISALNVYFRDLEHIISFLLQFAFYLTPIIFSVAYVPAKFQYLYKINPLSFIIESYRDIFFFGVLPQLDKLFMYGVVSIIVLAGGWSIYHILQRRFAEEI